VSDEPIVADASAVLALLKREPFDRFEPTRLFRTTISAVNLSEVLEGLCSGGLNELEAHAAVAELDLRVVDFDELQARLTAHLRSRTAAAGLSLGDRACLALGVILGCPVVTADRTWAGLDLRVKVVLIR
jgi:PIN domain nuclease of toxin-antitoxin system